MDIDDFEDFDWEDGVIIGGFWDYMTDQEARDERQRRKLEREMSTNPDDCHDWDEHDEENYL